MKKWCPLLAMIINKNKWNGKCIFKLNIKYSRQSVEIDSGLVNPLVSIDSVLVDPETIINSVQVD